MIVNRLKPNGKPSKLMKKIKAFFDKIIYWVLFILEVFLVIVGAWTVIQYIVSNVAFKVN